MDGDVVHLVGLIDELVALLVTHGETHWSRWLAYDATLLRASDGYGVTHFLRAFGTMGSLNDYISGLVMTGTRGSRRMSEVLDEAWRLADALRPESGADG